MTEQTKTCTKCGEMRALNEFPLKTKSTSRCARCKACTAEYHKQYRVRNKEKLVAYKRDRYQKVGKYRQRACRLNNPEVHRSQSCHAYYKDKNRWMDRVRRYAANHQEDVKKWKQASYRRSVDECKPSYIAKLFTRYSGFKVAEIPIDVIAMKRGQLQLIRLTRQLKQTVKEMKNV